MNDHLLYTLLTYCEFVRVGIKPMASVPYQVRYQEAVNRVLDDQALPHFSEALCEGWEVVYIYKDPLMKHIIKELPEEPATLFDHWVLGKAFGYSDSSIMEFLRGLSDSE